eukprot:1666846-Pleurochrysis_carterae.AAC.1
MALRVSATLFATFDHSRAPAPLPHAHARAHRSSSAPISSTSSPWRPNRRMRSSCWSTAW